MFQRTLGLVFPLLILLTFPVKAQTPAEYEAEYNKRVKQEMLNGVYIPSDLDDAFSELNRLSSPAGVQQFKNAPEEGVRRNLHFGLGKWILINWGLEDGSRISHYLKQKGVTLPDDMVEFIIVTWHRQLNNQPLNVETEINMIQKRMDEDKAKRDEGKKPPVVIDKKPHKG